MEMCTPRLSVGNLFCVNNNILNNSSNLPDTYVNMKERVGDIHITNRGLFRTIEDTATEWSASQCISKIKR